MIRILLAEQMSLLRGALAAVLSAEGDLEVAAEVSRVEEIVLMARAVKPDVRSSTSTCSRTTARRSS